MHPNWRAKITVCAQSTQFGPDSTLKISPNLPVVTTGGMRRVYLRGRENVLRYSNEESKAQGRDYKDKDGGRRFRGSWSWRHAWIVERGPYRALRFSGLPIANRKTVLLFLACGEKKLITSSS